MSTGVKNFSAKKLQAKLDDTGYTKSKFLVLLNRIAMTPSNRLLRLFPNARHLNRHLNGDSKPTIAYVKLYAKGLDCQMTELLNGKK